MKRRGLFFLWIALLLPAFLTACGSGKPSSSAPAPEATARTEMPAPTAEPTMEPVRALVVYFSRTGEMPETGVIEKGNTAIVAESIARRLNAGLYELRPADDRYPAEYQALYDAALAEQEAKTRPAIAGGLPDMDGYDVIFVGAPVWHGDWPMIMYTFFEGADLTDKTLVPFCTHQGSGLAAMNRELELICPYSRVLKGLAIYGTDAQNDPEKVDWLVERWLQKLEY